MSVDSVRETDNDTLVKILSGKLVHVSPVAVGPLDQEYVNLNLNYAPAMRVFFSSNKDPSKIFTTPIGIFDPLYSPIWNPVALFSVFWSYEIDNKRINFIFQNHDTVPRTITVNYQIYASRARQGT